MKEWKQSHIYFSSEPSIRGDTPSDEARLDTYVRLEDLKGASGLTFRVMASADYHRTGSVIGRLVYCLYYQAASHSASRVKSGV